jgi:predicted ATPase
VLITEMSGTGKSSLIAELAALGYKAVDTNAGWCEPQPDGRQRWREAAIQALLAAGRSWRNSSKPDRADTRRVSSVAFGTHCHGAG